MQLWGSVFQYIAGQAFETQILHSQEDIDSGMITLKANPFLPSSFGIEHKLIVD